MKKTDFHKNKLYEGRFFSEGYPELERMGVEYFREQQGSHNAQIDLIFECIERLINVSKGLKTVCVIGCGPNPTTVRHLLNKGYDAIGIEPVPGSAEAASVSLGKEISRIINSSAEDLALPSNSQRIVLFESVLEHVDSPQRSLSEAYRVLTPGGVAYVDTTNRHKVSLSGMNREFNVKFYNWLPDIVKECYVFMHLHYNPKLANYTPRPAVHWFTYPELCKLGRSLGFFQFYSIIDFVNTESQIIRNSRLRKIILNRIQHNPWLRAIALSQFGNSIFMLKRDRY